MDAEQLVLRRAAYWTSLKSEPAVVNETKRRIVVDRAKLFDTTAIRQILLAVARQEELG